MFVSQDFVVSFFVELSVMMLERLYLDPGAKEVRDVEYVVLVFGLSTSTWFWSRCHNVMVLASVNVILGGSLVPSIELVSICGGISGESREISYVP